MGQSADSSMGNMNFKFLTGNLLLACLISAQIVSSVPLTEDEVKQGLENTEQEIKDVLAGAEDYVESILPESIQGKSARKTPIVHLFHTAMLALTKETPSLMPWQM